jgi:hypothetical protein
MGAVRELHQFLVSEGLIEHHQTREDLFTAERTSFCRGAESELAPRLGLTRRPVRPPWVRIGAVLDRQRPVYLVAEDRFAYRCLRPTAIPSERGARVYSASTSALCDHFTDAHAPTAAISADGMHVASV